MNGIIYKHTCGSTGKSYIGQTIRTNEQRIAEHIKAANATGSRKTKFHRDIKKYGVDDFITTILYNGVVGGEDLDQLEIFFIKRFKTQSIGYNMTGGGDGFGRGNNNYWAGKPRYGKDNPFFGKKHTDESKTKMRKPKSKQGQQNIKIAAQNRTNPPWNKGIEVYPYTSTYTITLPTGEQHIAEHGLRNYCKNAQLSYSALSSIQRKGPTKQGKWVGWKVDLVNLPKKAAKQAK